MSQAPPKTIDKEYEYDDEEEGLHAEEVAMKIPNKFNPRTLPTKAYLDTFVIPQLLKALDAVAHERPENPVEFFAYYLLDQRSKENQPSQ